MEFCAGTLNGTPVVIVRSGVGKVNAAICAQILCDDFQVTHIINTGVAGSLKAEINIGDIVVSTDACYHDVDATIFGYALGEVPQLGVRFFEADKEMQEKAIASCKEVNPEIGVYSGRVVSGDQFIASRENCREFPRCLHGDGGLFHRSCGIFKQRALRHSPGNF